MMKTCAIYLNMIWNQFDFAQLLTLRMNSLQMAMNQKFFNLIQENFYQEKVFSIVYFSVALWQQLFNGEYNGLTSKKEHGSQSLLLFLLMSWCFFLLFKRLWIQILISKMTCMKFDRIILSMIMSFWIINYLICSINNWHFVFALSYKSIRRIAFSYFHILWLCT